MSSANSYTRFLPSCGASFSPDRFDRDLVRDFLFAFSRAEYALKAAGFVRAGKWGELHILWSAFAEEIAETLNAAADLDVLEAQRYLRDNPPKKQVLSASGLQWQAREKRNNQTDAQFLVESVTQVRNNLFHGGKELMGRLAERDRELVGAALTTVAFAVSAHVCVSALFEEVGPMVVA
jgi:hypothetical protein